MKKTLFAELLLAVFLGSAAQAQTVPMNIAVTNSVRDEWGAVLPGTDALASYFGYPVQTGAYVQVLTAPAGQKYPPAYDGTPNTNNVVVYESKIGLGVDPALGPVGKVGMSIPNRTALGTQIFVRVFNRSNPAESSFYGDSQVYAVPQYGNKYGVIYADIGATSSMLDPRDTDGDGLTNSWEISTGGSITNVDTDGDGFGDFHEFRAGTGLTNANSLLMMVHLYPRTDGNLVVSWDAVTGKVYQVEYTPHELTNNPAFFEINQPVTALTAMASTVITNALLSDYYHYRVRLVE